MVDISLTAASVWRVLKGPNNDWPLALCDFQTVDLVNDFTTNDALHQKRQGENWLLYANSKHKWHYLSSQEEDELIIFRNTDSEGILPRSSIQPAEENMLMWNRLFSCFIFKCVGDR